MALDSYTNLKTSIADWLHRSDLTSQIPDFITLAEAEIKRKLRRATTWTTLTVSGETTNVPTACAELRSVIFTSGSPDRDVPLRIGTVEMVAERKARSAGTAGRPTDGCLVNGQLLVAPPPDQTYTVNIFYYTQLTALSGSVASNPVLVEAPDAYLFGALLQAEPYLENDERIPAWQVKFRSAIDQLNEVRTREEFSASLRAIRLPVTF